MCQPNICLPGICYRFHLDTFLLPLLDYYNYLINIILIIFRFGKTNYWSTYSAYIRFVEHNVNILHSRKIPFD
jgi:hypothetical protein